MILEDLNTIASSLKNNYLEYNKNEVTLSNEFKEQYRKLIKADTGDDIIYYNHTSLVLKQNGLTISFPNQWFYIASYFVKFYKSLLQYKNKVSEIFSLDPDPKSTIKSIKETGVIPDNIEIRIETILSEEQDRIYFRRFLSDYSWWNGSKTVDRHDFFVSPILSLAEVVNASQSYIADITVTLSKSDQILEALKNSNIEKYVEKEAKASDVVIETDSIRDFALLVFKYFYSKDWKALLAISSTTNAKLNDTPFISYDINVFNRIIAQFNSVQNKSTLSSSGTLRYFEEPIFEENGNFYYFSTQWNGNDERDLNFKNIQTFFEKEFNNYLVQKIDGKYYLKSKLESYFNCDLFEESNIASGLVFRKQLLLRFVSSLLTKPFVILTGLSGSGKTKLAQSFVQWISESEDQYKIIPVGSDWTNREALLGYPNGLNNNSYVAPDSGALQLLIEASKESNQNKPYFMILDEMNLSHVERYFADFLSVMESNEKVKLYSGGKRYLKFKDDIPDELTLVPFELSWPKNLFIIGTVNIDETTYMFSPKVLDRANVIEFRISPSEMESFLNEKKKVDLDELFVERNKIKGGVGQNFGHYFLSESLNKDIIKSPELTEEIKILNSFFIELQNVGSEFGYRTASEIELLISKLGIDGFNDDDGNPLKQNIKIDIAIMQKLLPKLHGSRKKLVGPLETLAGLCLKRNPNLSIEDKDKNKTIYQQYISNNKNQLNWEVKYPISLEKIERMLKNVIENGYTSYAEA